jgi:hypothetical protein
MLHDHDDKLITEGNQFQQRDETKVNLLTKLVVGFPLVSSRERVTVTVGRPILKFLLGQKSTKREITLTYNHVGRYKAVLVSTRLTLVESL